MCIVFSIVGCVCWCSRVTISSMFIDGSSYVSFPRPFILCIHFCRMFWEWDEWPSPRDSGSLSCPSLRLLLMWLPSMSNLSWSLLLFVLLASSSFSFLLLIRHPHLTSCFFFPYHTLLLPVWHSTYIVLTYPAIRSFFFITSLSMSRSCWAHSGPWLTSFSIHVAFHIWGHGFLIIGYLSLVSFHFYYPITLAYVTSRVLRPPWGHGIRCRLWQPLLGQVFEI